jgi:hypothetical protein
MNNDQLHITSGKLEKGFVVTKPTGETGQGLVTKALRPINAQLFTTFGIYQNLLNLPKLSFTSIESL